MWLYFIYCTRSNNVVCFLVIHTLETAAACMVDERHADEERGASPQVWSGSKTTKNTCNILSCMLVCLDLWDVVVFDDPQSLNPCTWRYQAWTRSSHRLKWLYVGLETVHRQAVSRSHDVCTRWQCLLVCAWMCQLKYKYTVVYISPDHWVSLSSPFISSSPFAWLKGLALTASCFQVTQDCIHRTPYAIIYIRLAMPITHSACDHSVGW